MRATLNLHPWWYHVKNVKIVIEGGFFFFYNLKFKHQRYQVLQNS
jgi:hypothetical protein